MNMKLRLTERNYPDGSTRWYIEQKGFFGWDMIYMGKLYKSYAKAKKKFDKMTGVCRTKTLETK